MWLDTFCHRLASKVEKRCGTLQFSIYNLDNSFCDLELGHAFRAIKKE